MKKESAPRLQDEGRLVVPPAFAPLPFFVDGAPRSRANGRTRLPYRTTSAGATASRRQSGFLRFACHLAPTGGSLKGKAHTRLRAVFTG
jgi:hypothetical protein